MSRSSITLKSKELDVTNLGAGEGIFASINPVNNINLKSLQEGTNVDISGDSQTIIISVPNMSTSVSNGLNKQASGNVRLGGTLTATTTIAANTHDFNVGLTSGKFKITGGTGTVSWDAVNRRFLIGTGTATSGTDTTYLSKLRIGLGVGLTNSNTNYNFLSRNASTGDVETNTGFITTYSTYTGVTNTAINNRLLTTTFSTYTGVTNTAINNRLLTATFSAYSGVTNTAINNRVLTTTYGNYTGVTNTAINNRLLTTTFASYSGVTNTAINNRVLTTTYGNYTGVTNTAINNRLLTTTFASYSGVTNTAINNRLLTTNVSGTTNYVSKFTGTNTLRNSQIFDNGTNIGIGTTTPAYKLDVSGIGRVGNDFIISGVAIGDNGLKMDDGATRILSLTREVSNEARLYSYGFHSFYSGAGSGAERMRINSGGTVQLITVPSNDNALTQVLVRDGSTGEIKYKSVSTFAGGTMNGSGTVNRVAKFTGTTAIGNSLISDNGTTVSIGDISALSNVSPVSLMVDGGITTNQIATSDINTTLQIVSYGNPSVPTSRENFISSFYTNRLSITVSSGILFSGGTANSGIHLSSSGGVSIGNYTSLAPSATLGRLDCANDVVAFSSSDIRLKENIKPIENALEKVLQLNGIEFDWNQELKEAHGYDQHDLGVIAQEVKELFPDVVRTNDTGYLAVRYEKLIPVLIEAIKEQQRQINELKELLTKK